VKSISTILSDAKWWVIYRTTERYHVVRCDGLRPGYHEAEEQLLHSMFGILRDYVECELAWHELWCNFKTKKWESRKRRLMFWSEYRSREVGIEHLDWAASLVYDEDMGMKPGDEKYGEPTPQAEAAKEIKALYLWWVDERPKRKEPGEESGAYAAHEALDASGYQWFTPDPDNPHLSRWAQDQSSDLYKKWSECAALSHEIEERNHAEDTAMMKRLVDVRRSLWT
jgi:hypothetical protein